MPKPLDKGTIERAFGIMGQYLLDRKAFGEVCLFGGSALMFLFDWRQTSVDVDVVVRSEHGLILKARDEAALRLGLERSWLNEGVTQYASRVASDRDFLEVGIYPSYERPALRVVAAEPLYMLAMKVMALGERSTIDDRDFEDAVRIGRSLGLRGEEEIRRAVERYFPGLALPAVARARLPDLIRRMVPGDQE